MIFDRLFDPELPAPLMWLVLVWLFAVGACFGSFMNVVIYRLPAALSLLHPASRCPVCETPIRATDNVPIFGWLWLRGRCRHCRAAISARYPAVELLAALLFVGVAWFEPLSSGTKLPVSATDLTTAQLWGIYAFHVFFVCTLICAAFIEFDGHAVPWRLAAPALVVGLAAPLVWPQLRPFAGVDGTTPIWLRPLTDGLLGVAAGAALGCGAGLVSQVPPKKSKIQSRRAGTKSKIQNLAIALAWVGTFLGWQAAVALAVLAAATRLLAALVGRWMPVAGRIGLIGCLTPWTVVWLVAWKPIVERLPWLGAG